MPLQHRIEALEKRHADINAQLEAEEAHPAVDEGKLHQLKKEKLQIKDEIARLRKEAA